MVIRDIYIYIWGLYLSLGHWYELVPFYGSLKYLYGLIGRLFMINGIIQKKIIFEVLILKIWWLILSPFIRRLQVHNDGLLTSLRVDQWRIHDKPKNYCKPIGLGSRKTIVETLSTTKQPPQDNIEFWERVCKKLTMWDAWKHHLIIVSPL